MKLESWIILKIRVGRPIHIDKYLKNLLNFFCWNATLINDGLFFATALQTVVKPNSLEPLKRFSRLLNSGPDNQSLLWRWNRGIKTHLLLSLMNSTMTTSNQRTLKTWNRCLKVLVVGVNTKGKIQFSLTVTPTSSFAVNGLTRSWWRNGMSVHRKSGTINKPWKLVLECFSSISLIISMNEIHFRSMPLK